MVHYRRRVYRGWVRLELTGSSSRCGALIRGDQVLRCASSTWDIRYGLARPCAIVGTGLPHGYRVLVDREGAS